MNPYARDLGDRPALDALAETPERVRAVVSALHDQDFARSYQPGKWTAAQLLDHLAQTEMVFGTRVRMALTADGYVVQPYDQDLWITSEARRNPREAFEAYYALRRWNLTLFRGLSAEQRARSFTHPERGPMTVADLLDLLAGHERHHATHLEGIARGAGK